MYLDEAVVFPKKSIPLISKKFRNNRIVVVTFEGIIVGVCGLKFEGKEFVDLSFWRLLLELKFWILRVLFFGWLFYCDVKKKELLIDVLAVARDMRGKGIGSKLTTFIVDFAQSKQFEQVKLSVINTNEKAKKLYESLGFKEVKTHRTPFPWSKILGFSSTSEMRYVITPLDNS